MAEEESLYISFLLRLWLADDNGEQVSRASLESPLTGESKRFANLDDLFNYLKKLGNLESEEPYNEA